MNDNVLTGHYFHGMTDRDSEFQLLEPSVITTQGYVVGSPAPGWFLVQFFSWAMGEEIHRALVSAEDMKLWRFYETAEEMRENYEVLKAQKRAK